MHDTPYTTADEDPFHVTPLRRRRSSLLDKWIRDQQILPSVPPETATSAVESYLEYNDDDPSVHSYDLVQDQDIPHSADLVTHFSDFAVQSQSDTPLQDYDTITPSRASRHASRLLHRATSFRNFNIHFRSSNPVQPDSPRSSSRPSSRLSFLTKNPLQAVNSASSGDTSHHNRSSSLSTVQGPGSCASTRNSIATISSRWRPSVLGHFSTPSMSSHVSTPTPKIEPPYTPPRPSVSSADTFLSGASDNDLGHFFSKLSLVETFRSRGDPSKSRIASSSSIWSQSQTSAPSPCDSPRSISSQRPRNSATYRPYAPAFDEELDEVEEESDLPSPPPETSTRPQIAYSSGRHLSRVRFPSLARRHKKKRRLVVSGIKPNDIRKFENLKRWCENFGEVSQITRMPNNDLHVHFRRADVAETVCRLRAKVHINGVGSVQLSWSYGEKH